MIETRNLIKTFRDGDKETPVLRGIDFRVAKGQYVSIMGRSGAGKSTFLYQMSLLDDPTGGEVIIDGHPAAHMSAAEKTRFRLSHFGYVFQDYALLPDLTAIENVLLPLLMQGMRKSEARALAEAALKRLGLSERLHSLPSHLSGGEQQRVSIARAVAHHPKILFADEPTANLDSESSRVIMNIFAEIHREGQTIIMITHEEQYAKMAEQTITLEDGRITTTLKNR
ncbi:MAG: ABC transporter ATP-binding protein [bacterium]|nr:ABC transporter ATP-binding protein [bacterium]